MSASYLLERVVLKTPGHVRIVGCYPTTATIDTTLRCVAESYGVTVDVLKTRARRRDAIVIDAKHVAAYLLYMFAPLTMPMIARTLGYQDHTTIMYARDKVSDLIATDERYAAEISRLRDEIKDGIVGPLVVSA